MSSIRFILLMCLLIIGYCQCFAQGSNLQNDKLRFQAAYYIANNSDSALPIIKKLKKNEPNNYQNLLIEGSYYTQRNPKLAKRNFQQACDVCNCADAFNCLASSYSNSGNYDSTILVLKKSISLNANQPEVLASIANFYFFQALTNSTLGDSTLVYANRAYNLDTTNVSILKQYTHFLKYFSPRSKVTLFYFDRLAKLDIHDTVANTYVATSLMDSGYCLRALPYAITAQQNYPKSSKSNFMLANCYLQNYNNDMADKFVKKAIILNSNDSVSDMYFHFLLENISKCEPYDSLYSYLIKGSRLNLPTVVSYKRYIDSVTFIISAFRNSNGITDSLNKLAELYYYTRNYKKAAECLDRIVQESINEVVGDLIIQRVSLFIEMGQMDEALNYINARLKTSHNNYLLFFYAVINTQIKQFDTAKKIFLKLQKDQALPELSNTITQYLAYMAKNSEISGN